MAITKITKTELLELTSTTGAVRLPSGTTAERPSTNLNAGDFRFNTDDNKVEYYDGSNWFQVQDEGEPPVPSENFNTVLWNANDSSQAITGVGFQPDFVWIKRRSSSEPYALYDSVRGINQQLETNSQNPQATNTSPYEGFTSFDSDGFTVGNNGATNRVPNTYVGWCFKAGGAAVSNSNGSISSSVSANTEAGFSIVSYTGNGAAGATVGHGLTAAPNLVITKGTTGSAGNTNWNVYSSTLGATKKLMLNSSDGENTNTTWWNDTAPTSTVFSLGTTGDSNYNSSNYIAYCFHNVTGYQKIGSYTGNGSANGPIVETGFEPAFLLIKQTNTSGNNWVIYDNKRDLANARYKYLSPNNTDAEGSDHASNYPIVNFLTNGFEIAGTDGRVNASSGTYMYLAIAADADTTTPTLANSFKTNLYTGNGGTQTIGGHLNGAAQFNGSNGTIAFTNPIPTGSKTSMAFSLWLSFNNIITSSFYGIFGTQVNSQSPPFVLNMYGSSNYINASFERYENGNQYYSSQYSSVGAYKYEVGRWYHLACSYDSSTDEVSIYINGAHLQTYTIPLQATGRVLTNSSFLGAYDTLSGSVRNSFNGSIDQVRIYDSTLTASEVLELYNETTATANTLNFPTGAGCVAAYPLDTNSNDLSGNYNGTDSNITYSEGPAFKPTFIWMKARQATATQALQDSVRGVSKFAASNGVDPQYSYPGYGVVSYNNDGWTLTDVASGGYAINGAPGGTYAGSNAYYVGWTWKGAVNLPTINTDGTTSSIVSANPAAGFSIVKFSVTNTSINVGHGLSSPPEMIIWKNLDTSDNWYVYHKDLSSPNTQWLNLNLTLGPTTNATNNFSSVTSTTFTSHLYGGSGTNNAVAYCFHSISNYCKVGSYTGNGGSKIVYTTDDGTLGGNNPFQPTWVMIKNLSNGYSWIMTDSSRGTSAILYANLGDGEASTSTHVTSFNSNGFTVGSNADVNNNNDVYVYLALKQ